MIKSSSKIVMSTELLFDNIDSCLILLKVFSAHQNNISHAQDTSSEEAEKVDDMYTFTIAQWYSLAIDVMNMK